MKHPLSYYWKAIISVVGNAALAAQLWFNDHGPANGFSTSEKWSLFIAVLATIGVYSKANTPYPDTALRR